MFALAPPVPTKEEHRAICGDSDAIAADVDSSDSGAETLQPVLRFTEAEFCAPSTVVRLADSRYDAIFYAQVLRLRRARAMAMVTDQAHVHVAGAEYNPWKLAL